MRKLLLVTSAGIAFVIAIIMIITLADPASSGEPSKGNMAQPAPAKCGFGYVDLPSTPARICVPTLFQVQPGDTISDIAKSWGNPNGWHTMCSFRWETKTTIVSWPGFDPHVLPIGSYVGGCPRHHRDLDSVLQRMNDDQHRPSSTDA